jgi:immune inhibitor A
MPAAGKPAYNRPYNKPKLHLIVIIALLFLLSAYLSAHAVAPPLDPNQSVPRHILDNMPPPEGYGRMITPLVPEVAFGPLKAMGDGIGNMTLQNYIKTNTNVNLIVVLVEFSDVKMGTNGRTEIGNMVTNLTAYFREQSRNTITVTSTLSASTYNLNKTMAAYGATDDVGQLARDAVAASDPDINFANYQCIMVAHAGFGDETSGTPNGGDDIWSMYWYRASGSGNLITTNDGVGINGVTIVPEKEYGTTQALGTICHEFGHQFGLPDLYDTTYNTEGGMGRWSLMATGNYNGTPKGSKPAFLDPICRKLLGWSDLVNITENQQNFNFEFGKTYRLEKGGAASGTDYYYIEKRGLITGSWDEGLPGEGLLIFHVNGAKETTNNPNDATPRLIELKVASGGDHLTSGPPRSSIRGLSTDPYPTAGNKEFHNTSTPSSKSWTNQNSYIGVRDIVKTGTGASLNIKATAVLVKPNFIAALGNNQSAAVNTQFPAALRVNLAESSGPISATAVTFSVTSGPASINGLATVNTDAAGNAQISVTAGATAGAVVITATATPAGWTTPLTAVFNLSVTGGGGPGSGPLLLGSGWQDVNTNGIADAGDRINLIFDAAITISGVAASDFTLPVSGDSLGSAPSFAIGSLATQLAITLGASCKITAPGVFNPAVLAPGSPSGINLSATMPSGRITGTTGGNARPAAAAVDIAAPAGAGPRIVAATLNDMNGNAQADAGDKIAVVFDKAVIISGVVASDFALPVNGDSFGSSPSFTSDADALKLIITLGASCKITAPGIFNSGQLTAGAPSGINISSSIIAGHITDIGGNNAAPSAAAVDIALTTEIGDVSTSKSYITLKNSGEQPFIANGATGAIFEATILDDNGNAIPGCDVFITSDRNQFANIDLFTPASPSKTEASGKISFTVKTTQTGTRTITIEAQKTGNAKKTIGSQQIEYKAGAVSPSLSTISATRTLIVADGADSAEISVSLRDANHNPVIQKLVTINPNPSTGVIITPASTATDTGGNAKFVIKSNQPANNVIITAVADGGIMITQTLTLTFMSQMVSIANSRVEEAVPGSVYIANGQVNAHIIITLRNASNLPIANITPQVSVSGMNNSVRNSDGQPVPPNAIRPTNAEGKTYFEVSSVTSEQKTIIVKVDGISLNQQPVLNFAAGPYDRLTYSSGNTQVGAITTKLPRPLKVQVLDANNNRVSGAVVKFRIVQQPVGAMGAALSTAQMSSDSSGYAWADLTLGSAVGLYKVNAELTGAKDSPVVFNLDAQSGPPSTMIIESGNGQNGAIGEPLNQPLAVKVFDASGNPSPNVIVHFRQSVKPLDASDCQLTQLDVPTDNFGMARALVAKLGDKVGQYKITASITTPPVSLDFTLTAVAGTPALMQILTGESQNAVVNTPAASPLKLVVKDNSGNNVSSPVPGCAVRFFIYKGSGALSAEMAQTNAAGEASVNYTAGRAIGPEEIWASVEGNYNVSPVRFYVNATAAAADKLINGNYYSSAYGRAGEALQLPFAVRVVDIYGNPVAGRAVTVNIGPPNVNPPASGHSVIKVEPADSKTNSEGLVSCFVRLGDKTGTYEVTMTAAGLIGSPFKFEAAATSGVLSAQKTILAVTGGNGATADGISTIEVSVGCKDEFNNPVTGAYAYFYSDQPSVLNIIQPQEPTGANGTAKAYIRSSRNGVFKIKTSVNSVNIAGEALASFVSGPFTASASQYYLHQPPAKVLANNSDFYTVKVEARDAKSNPVSGVSPSRLAVNNGDPINVSITYPADDSDTYGVMLFKVKASQQGVKTLEVYIDGERIQTNDRKNFIELAFVTNPVDTGRSYAEVDGALSAPADGNSEIRLKIFVRDTANAPISGLNFQSFQMKFKNIKTGGYETMDLAQRPIFYDQADYSYNFSVKTTKASAFEVETTVVSDQTNYKLGVRPLITFTSGPASQMLNLNGADIYSRVAERSLTLLNISVVDAFNNPVHSAAVDFSLISAPEGAQHMSVEKSSTVYTDDNGMATTSITLGTVTGLYVFKAESFGLNGSPVYFSAYATPGTAASYELRNIPVELMQAQPIKQIELAVYDSYGNLKYDCADAIYLLSSDKSAVLPYNSIDTPYIFSAGDNGRKVFNEGLLFLTVSSSTTLTVKKVTSVSPLESTSPPMRVVKMQQQQTSNFFIGSFFVPGSSNHVMIMAKSKSELISPPELNISFDGGPPSAMTMNNTSKARVYYKVVEVKAKPLKADVKIFAQSSGSGDYLFSEEVFNY